MDSNQIIYFSEREQNNLSSMAKWFYGIGFAILILGIASVILPHIGTLTVNILVAAILLISGIVHLTHAFRSRKWRTTTWEVLMGLVFLFTGILFVLYPWSGAVALTLLLGLFFLLTGAFKIMLAISWRMRPGWGWLMASAILSMLLGILVIIGLPATAVWVIGLILGIDLIFSGATLIALGSKIKSILAESP